MAGFLKVLELAVLSKAARSEMKIARVKMLARAENPEKSNKMGPQKDKFDVF